MILGGISVESSQLRYFLETARTQHITKSANKLHIAQPALSKSIHRLEEELGVPLFMKKGRNIILTDYGRYLQNELTPIINSIDNIPSAIEKMAKIERKTIRLSVQAASTLITQAIIEYKRTFPDVNFHLIQNPDDELFDIEITTNLFYNNNKREHNVFVCTENIFLAVPNTGDNINKTAIKLTEVKNEGFISLFGSKQLRIICDKFCHHAGFEPKIIFDSDSPDAVKNMIAANMGIGFWPEFSWGKIDTQQVKLLKIINPICKRDIVITYKNIKSSDSVAENFFNYLIDYVKNKKRENG